ncbi:EpsG family protein [Flavivirga amylovorans]|uniref:EpsG family protein n=1 Tax=Flavivirga amylovorans TaxID=870486 RepID=A0ABT8X2D7_9FLAO|nr:EpsG family protein [Flavivirga amylovorans]MDO5987878.1 EpsG family protein [Flavivirga amylovorans]
MINFIPLEYYYSLYINLMLFLVLFTIFHALLLNLDDTKNVKYLSFTGNLIFLFLVVYIGLRPISGMYFVDMATYARHYYNYAYGAPILSSHDLGFHAFMKFCSGWMPIHLFFLVCAFLYIYPMYYISKRFFGKYWFYSFLMFVVSFSFWTYGVNGIRNGIATSIFLLAFSVKDKKILMALLMLLACSFHKTLMLPTLAYIATFFYNNPKTYLKIWLIAIPLSLFLGFVWISLFTKLGFGDDRLGGYLTGEKDAKFENVGFRWDFLIYSSSAVFAGWYFIFKKKFTDQNYYRLFNIYLICNAFWILVIRANFSNRFAYISWFMMSIIVVYPYLKSRFFEKQNLALSKVIFLYFAFTYLMSYVYYA